MSSAFYQSRLTCSTSDLLNSASESSSSAQSSGRATSTAPQANSTPLACQATLSRSNSSSGTTRQSPRKQGQASGGPGVALASSAGVRAAAGGTTLGHAGRVASGSRSGNGGGRSTRDRKSLRASTGISSQPRSVNAAAGVSTSDALRSSLGVPSRASSASRAGALSSSSSSCFVPPASYTSKMSSTASLRSTRERERDRDGELEGVDLAAIASLLADAGAVALGPLMAQGSSAYVFLGSAHDDEGRVRGRVVCKVVPWTLGGRSATAAIEAEVSVLQTVTHLRVLPLLGVLHSDELQCTVLVTPLCANGSLYESIHMRGDASDELVRALAECAQGMIFLHGQGVIHGDLTSPNVLLAEDGARIADFGHARVLRSGETAAVGRHGNLAWAAPEFAISPCVTTACDVYSFGVIMYEVITRLVPFAGYSRSAIRDAKAAGALPGPNMPEGSFPHLQVAMPHCLSPYPSCRPTFFDMVTLFK